MTATNGAEMRAVASFLWTVEPPGRRAALATGERGSTTNMTNADAASKMRQTERLALIDALYRKYRKLLVWHVLRSTRGLDAGAGGSRAFDDPEDVVHDAVERLLRKRGLTPSKAILVTIVRATAANAVRRGAQTFQPYTFCKRPTTSVFPTQIFGCSLRQGPQVDEERAEE